MNTFFSIVLLAVLLTLLDLVWLTLRSGYHKALFASVQGSPLQVRYVPAVLVYVLLAVGLWYSAVKSASSIKQAALSSFLTGFVMYAFYDMTNLATFTRWTWEMAVTDSLWGGILSAAAGAIAFTYLVK